MHAASAGEAGRGFAVVADEVQRLAESSQKATLDIAAMVNAIREETSDTLETMNRLIAQVAEGTRQAQEAGSRMRETETTTADLVKSVREMAEGAGLQAQSALELRKQSQVIVRSTEQTSVALKEQSTYTLRLVEYANTLREAISVFKLTNSMDNEI
jgi:twitching motility protein PilJ